MKETGPKSYFRYWGKAEKDGSGYHLLPYHCLDVGAVAAAWWDEDKALTVPHTRGDDRQKYKFRNHVEPGKRLIRCLPSEKN